MLFLKLGTQIEPPSAEKRVVFSLQRPRQRSQVVPLPCMAEQIPTHRFLRLRGAMPFSGVAAAARRFPAGFLVSKKGVGVLRATARRMCHSVRKCNDCCIIHISNNTVLTFADIVGFFRFRVRHPEAQEASSQLTDGRRG